MAKPTEANLEGFESEEEADSKPVEQKEEEPVVVDPRKEKKSQ
jgi:hypothetical protein